MLKIAAIFIFASSLLIGCSSKPADDGMKPMNGSNATPEQIQQAQDQLKTMPQADKPGMEEPRKDGQ